MNRRFFSAASLLAAAITTAIPAAAEEPFWGIQAEQLEFRLTERSDVLAWDFDALYGTDELKLVWRSEAEYATADSMFENLENQIRLQTPISTFFDAVVGVRLNTPDGSPNRVHGVVGLKGLAPQWFEVDADLYISDNPFFRFEAEYEALITNRIILTPVVEVELPLTDDPEIGVGAWGPKIEVGARISYDLIDRAVSPYVGVHYEQKFGETANLANSDGEDSGTVFFVVGTKILF